MSWIFVPATSDFPLQNLPFGVFSRKTADPCKLRVWGDKDKAHKKSKNKKGKSKKAAGAFGEDCPKSVGVRIGDFVLDLRRLAAVGFFGAADSPLADALSRDTLNTFMGLSSASWSEVRARVTELLSKDNESLQGSPKYRKHLLVPVVVVTMHLPAAIGDYTDFYASMDHAKNVGIMFRGADNALLPNWKHIPVGYHGRASSIVPSGTGITRPNGQKQTDPDPNPIFGPSGQLDFELEIGCFVGGPTNPLGTPVSIEEAESRIFGFVLLNDWSARDIQKWEYVPLGPFLGKNFGTSISPWVVTAEALRPFRCAAVYEHEPKSLPYLQDATEANYNVALQVAVKSAKGTAYDVICNSNMKYLYWTFKQQLTHHASGGCNMVAGDLLGSGTISGPTPQEFGSMLELAWKGTKPVKLSTGEERKFLADGDSVRMSGFAVDASGARIGFGECEGTILPAHK